MPALSGEPWRGLAKAQVVDNATSNGRYATASIADVDPVLTTGDQLDWQYDDPSAAYVLRAEWGGGGVGSPAQIESIVVSIRDIAAGSQIGDSWTFTPSGDTGVQTRLLHFDTNPLNQSLDAANIREGLFEIVIQIIKSSGSGATQYNLNSRGTATVGPPALTTYSWARGYLRRNIVLSSATLSNVTYNGAEPPAPWHFGDPVFVRATLDALSYALSGSCALTLSVRRPQGSGGAEERAETTNQTNPLVATQDFSLEGTGGGVTHALGGGMFAGSELKDIDLTLGAGGGLPTFGGDQVIAWAATGHPAGWARISESILRYVGRITVDPRVDFTNHLLQLDDPTYGTPPMSKNVSPATREDVDFGFVSERALAARGTGINGLGIVTKMWDVSALSGNETTPTLSRSTTSSTQGGEAGWSSTFLSWGTQYERPIGGWVKKVIITFPANAAGLEINNTDTLTLIGHDSRIQLVVASGDMTRPGTHWSPGQPFTIGAHLFRGITPLSFDTGTGKTVVFRFNPATGKIQALQSVLPAVWVDVATDVDPPTFPMTSSPGDVDIALKTFTGEETADFDTKDLYPRVLMDKDMGTYVGGADLIATGPESKHDVAHSTASELTEHIAEAIATAHPNGELPEARVGYDRENGHSHFGQSGNGSNPLSGKFIPRTPPS